MTKNVPVLDIHEKPKLLQGFFLSIQHVFAMFGATVLAPTLMDMNPSTALIASGIATLTFIIVTRGKIPTYLGSSFVYVSPILTIKAMGNNPSDIMIGSIIVALTFIIISAIMKKAGSFWINRLIPPVVMAPIVMIIGLSLAPTAIKMVSIKNDEPSIIYQAIGMFTLIITIVIASFGKGILKVIPIIMGLIIGFIICLSIGEVDTEKIATAKWITHPEINIPFLNFEVDLSLLKTIKIAFLIIPAALISIVEHIGHQVVLGKVVNKDFIEEPGLGRSILGDGLATMTAALIGGPPNTTYGENIGVLAITKVYSIFVFIGASIIAIILGFSGKVSALLQNIPSPVMGGVSILLFGVIASSGLKIFVDKKIDLGNQRNLIITATILIIGIGNIIINFTETFKLDGLSIALIVGIVLNAVLPKEMDNIKEPITPQQK